MHLYIFWNISYYIKNAQIMLFGIIFIDLKL